MRMLASVIFVKARISVHGTDKDFVPRRHILVGLNMYKAK